MTHWHPMESAPRDGTAIQAKIPGHGANNIIAFHDQEGDVGAWVFVTEQDPPDDWIDGVCWGINEEGKPSTKPTEWKPLPGVAGAARHETKQYDRAVALVKAHHLQFLLIMPIVGLVVVMLVCAYYADQFDRDMQDLTAYIRAEPKLADTCDHPVSETFGNCREVLAGRFIIDFTGGNIHLASNPDAVLRFIGIGDWGTYIGTRPLAEDEPWLNEMKSAVHDAAHRLAPAGKVAIERYDRMIAESRKRTTAELTAQYEKAPK